MNKERLQEVLDIMSENIGNKVNYRLEGINVFTEDKLVDCRVNGDQVDIELSNKTIENFNVKDLSFKDYGTKIDIWIYGDLTNLFTIGE
ncbi:hypothetical protein H1W83_11690 [Priestia megaterium]|uniref:hypothetical protein n=1 Tax=Priestia megaterium TaxID=1404 RepID=UPI001ED9F86A|nr:hypothetical protein [Priestia megaterium]UKJ82888.1 hypothetical protein H1W83_11690 [Priestia megaterium]